MNKIQLLGCFSVWHFTGSQLRMLELCNFILTSTLLLLIFSFLKLQIAKFG